VQARPLWTLTFKDCDVYGGPNTGRLLPWDPLAHPGVWVGDDSRRPDWAAAMHTGPPGQPQARPGPCGQHQHQNHKSGSCHPCQAWRKEESVKEVPWSPQGFPAASAVPLPRGPLRWSGALKGSSGEAKAEASGGLPSLGGGRWWGS
jgi:hypothetical protein